MKLPGSVVEGIALRRRIVWLGVAAALGVLVLAGRLWYLQIFKGEEFSAKSSGNFIKELRVPADRGMILDRRGRRLVDNRPSWDLYLTPAFCEGCDEVIGRLAVYLHLDGEELDRLTEGIARTKGLDRFRPLLVRRDLPRDELDVIEAHRDLLPGTDVIPTPHRDYRYGSSAAHLIGYLGEVSQDELEKGREEGLGYRLGDYIGKRGIERRFESLLRGKDGIERVVTDAKGRRLPELEGLIPKEERYVASLPGKNLVLSIDAELQHAAEEIFDVPTGAMVVMEVQTGYVLAMVSKPGFDPNRMTGRISRDELKSISEDPLEPMIFRPLQNHYHPGSVFKVIAQLAAFEQGFTQDVFCGGGYTLGRRRWRCHKESGHGWTSPEEAMKVSCDTWFYAAADRIGIDPIADMSRRFGLGSTSGLDLGYEVPGIVPSTEYHQRHSRGGYQRGFALNSVIGQGDNNVTPIQMAVVFAAIANGGTIYRPQVVRRAETPGGQSIEEFLPEVRSKLSIPRPHMERIRRGLEKVMEEPGGTAYRHRLPEIRTAGKTGTAQVVRIGAVRLKTEEMDFFSRDHGWFVAYGPVEEPQVVVVVLNEHGGSGGANAAPYAMAVLARYFEILERERSAYRDEEEPPAARQRRRDAEPPRPPPSFDEEFAG